MNDPMYKLESIKAHCMNAANHCKEAAELAKRDGDRHGSTYYTAIKNEMEWLLDLYFGIKPEQP